MKFFNFRLDGGKKISNALIMLLAVIGATSMWYFVSKRDVVERQVEVGLDYYGIPQDLIVTRGLVSKIIVRVRGPEILMRSLPQEAMQQSINLSHIKKGETRVPFGEDQVQPRVRGFHIIDIAPPGITVYAEPIIERSVPVHANVISPLEGDALTYENVNVDPSTVVIRGPESAIKSITDIPVTIRLDPKLVGTRQANTETLDTPSLVTAKPARVNITYTITSSRVALNCRCPIVVAGDTADMYEVYPRELEVRVEVPERLARDKKYLRQLEASVAPPAMNFGESRQFKLRFHLPEGMTMLSPRDQEVTVTRKPEKQNADT